MSSATFMRSTDAETLPHDQLGNSDILLNIYSKQDTEFSSASSEVDTNILPSSPFEQRKRIRSRGFSARGSAVLEGQFIENIKQKWAGVIIDCDPVQQLFSCRLTDITAPTNPDEIMTINFEDIEIQDRHLLEVGASFTWYIGYKQGSMVSRESFSKFKFRRLPAWSSEELSRAATKAKEMANFFRDDRTNTP